MDQSIIIVDDDKTVSCPSTHTIDRAPNQLDRVPDQVNFWNDNCTQMLLATTAPRLISHLCHGSDATCELLDRVTECMRGKGSGHWAACRGLARITELHRRLCTGSLSRWWSMSKLRSRPLARLLQYKCSILLIIMELRVSSKKDYISIYVCHTFYHTLTCKNKKKTVFLCPQIYATSLTPLRIISWHRCHAIIQNKVKGA